MHGLPLYLVANERPLINIDVTLFINIGLWLVLFFLLRPLLWAPILKLIGAREKGMAGARTEARRLEVEAKERREKYEAAQKKARSTASEAREKIRSDSKVKEAEILADARNSTQEVLDKQRAEILAQRKTLETEIRATIPSLAGEIASKVLGREVRA